MLMTQRDESIEINGLVSLLNNLPASMHACEGGRERERTHRGGELIRTQLTVAEALVLFTMTVTTLANLRSKLFLIHFSRSCETYMYFAFVQSSLSLEALVR